MGRIIIITSLLLIINNVCQAQINTIPEHVEFVHITTQHGLTQSTPLSILQDSKGYMWFGTYNGLSKYNGYTFENYRPVKDDSSTLSHQVISVIFEDSNQNLWIGTHGGGVCLYERENNAFIQYRHNPEDVNSINNNEVRAIEEDHLGNIWIGTNGGGLNKVIFPDNGSLYDLKFRHYMHDPDNENSLTCDYIRAIVSDRKKRLWVGTLSDNGGGLNKVEFTRKGLKYTRYKHNKADTGSLSHDFVKSIIEDDNGNIWIGTDGGGLNKYVEDADAFKHYTRETHNNKGLTSDFIWNLEHAGNGKLWLGSKTSGLFLFNPVTESFRQYKNNPTDESSLSGDRISSIHHDQSGILWVGVNDGYVNKTDLQAKKFQLINVDLEYPNSLRNNNVWTVSEDDDNNLWVGTDAGITVINEQKTTYKHYYKGKELKTDFVRKIFKDHAGVMWIGTINGISKYIPTEDRFKHYDIRANISSFAEDKDGELWIGDWGNGLLKYDKKKDRFKNYKASFKIKPEEDINQVWKVFVDSENRIWVAIKNRGIYQFDKDQEKFISYNDPNVDDLADMQAINIYSIYEDSGNRIWLGSNDGVFQFDPEADMHCCKIDKKISPLVAHGGILEDEEGDLWLGTLDGIARVNPKNGKSTKFGVDDGLQGKEYNRGSLHHSEDGTMYFGGKNGLNYFQPDKLKINKFKPPIEITDFKLFNRSVKVDKSSPLKKPINNTEEIVLTHKQNSFSFEFVALNFRNPENNQYAYKLEGFDKEWNYIGSRRIANYTSIEEGEYIFKVKAANNDGIWTDKEARIKLIILPPFWRQWWFRISLGIFVLLLIWGWNKARLYQLKSQKRLLTEEVNKRTSEVMEQKKELELNNHELARQKEQLAEMSKRVHEADQMKIRFFTNISHEFRTPITLILGPLAELSENMVNQTSKNRHLTHIIQRNADRLLRLVNQIMDISKIESGHMRLGVKRGDIVSFIKEITHSFDYKANVKKIDFRLYTNQKSYLGYFDADKLEKIIYNILSNAFKFTAIEGCIEVDVTFFERDNTEYTNVIIRDNGIGISQDQLKSIFKNFYQIDYAGKRGEPGTGIGLSLAYQLAKIHHGKIEVHSEKGVRTEFIIEIPISKHYYTEAEFSDQPETYNEQVTQPDIKIESNPEHQIAGLETKQGQFINEPLPKVLVIEDNDDIQNFIYQGFSGDYNVYQAFDGESGYHKALEILPQLIITDVMMPKVDGMTLCQRLKSHEKTSHIPVIILTAKTGHDNEIKGFECGADDYIVKPFELSLLKARVINLMNNRKQLKEKYIGKIQLKDNGSENNGQHNDFIVKAVQIVIKYLSDITFDADKFAGELGMSRTKLYNKIHDATGLSVNEFIKSIRLKNAASYLLETDLDVSEIAYNVGFNERRYFSKCFKKQYGKSPLQYRESNMV